MEKYFVTYHRTKQEAVCRVSIGDLALEEKTLFEDESPELRWGGFVLSSENELGLFGEGKEGIIARRDHKRLLEIYKTTLRKSKSSVGLNGYETQWFSSMLDFVYRADEIRSVRKPPATVAVDSACAGVPANYGDAGSADPPSILMAPSSESQVDTLTPKVVSVFEPMDRKEMVDTLIEANLKTEALKNTPFEMKKERDIVFSETYGLTATDIARLDGATDANVRSKSDTIQKRLDRSK